MKFHIEPRFVHANPKVRADSGKAALMRGPLVYCLEETDNGSNLASVFVDTRQELSESYEPELLGGTTVIHLNGKKISDSHWEDGTLYQECETELTDIPLKAVPYCYWGNRRTGEMLVWIKELL